MMQAGEFPRVEHADSQELIAASLQESVGVVNKSRMIQQ